MLISSFSNGAFKGFSVEDENGFGCLSLVMYLLKKKQDSTTRGGMKKVEL